MRLILHIQSWYQDSWYNCSGHREPTECARTLNWEGRMGGRGKPYLKSLGSSCFRNSVTRLLSLPSPKPSSPTIVSTKILAGRPMIIQQLLYNFSDCCVEASASAGFRCFGLTCESDQCLTDWLYCLNNILGPGKALSLNVRLN
jgi:hypothetical protein